MNDTEIVESIIDLWNDDETPTSYFTGRDTLVDDIVKFFIRYEDLQDKLASIRDRLD